MKASTGVGAGTSSLIFGIETLGTNIASECCGLYTLRIHFLTYHQLNSQNPGLKHALLYNTPPITY